MQGDGLARRDARREGPRAARGVRAVAPEQRRFLHAIARSLPWTAAAIAVTIAVCALLGAPRWAAPMLVPAVAFAVPVTYARDERRAMRARRAAPPSPWLRALVAAHVVLPLAGVPLAIEGLRTGNRALAIVGTGLLALVVVDAAIVLPWRVARRQKRERARRAR